LPVLVLAGGASAMSTSAIIVLCIGVVGDAGSWSELKLLRWKEGGYERCASCGVWRGTYYSSQYYMGWRSVVEVLPVCL
jgi:hypothetical protein